MNLFYDPKSVRSNTTTCGNCADKDKLIQELDNQIIQYKDKETVKSHTMSLMLGSMHEIVSDLIKNKYILEKYGEGAETLMKKQLEKIEKLLQE